MDRLLNRLTISRIMSVFSLIIVILIMINGLFIATTAKDEVKSAIERGVYNQVNAAAAVIDDIIVNSDYNMALAKPKIVKFLDSFRWGKDNIGYLFINETQTNTQIHHTYKPQINGKRTFVASLEEGGTFEQATQAVSRSQTSQLVHYLFDNPTTGAPEKKATYIFPLKQKNWVLSGGVYLSEAEQAFFSVLEQVSIGILALIVCVIFLIVGISRYFKHQINWIQKGLQDKFGSSALRSSNTNEIAQLGFGVNVLFTTFNRVINVLGHSSSSIAGAAAKQQILSKNAMNGMAKQQHEMEGFATAMNEMVATVSEVASNSTNAACEIAQVKDLAKSGETSMQRTANSITGLSTDLEVSGKVIEQLEQNSKQIESVVNVISDIADQTNLLALNAAIEAARAGDQGRGFAVVADEVRELARKTTHSTSEIRTMIEQLQSRVAEVVHSIESCIQNAGLSVNIANDSQKHMSDISALLDGVADMTTQIATAAEEQTSVSEEMNKNIHIIGDIVSHTYKQVEDTDDAAGEIHELVSHVYQEVSEVEIADPVYHINQAKMAHQLWLGRMNNFLAGKEHLNEDEGTSHTNCKLGQWYTTEALTEFKHIVGVKELESPHRAFHAKIKELKKAKANGELDKIETQFGELIEISQQVVDCLDKINSNIHNDEQSRQTSSNLATSRQVELQL